MVRLNISVHDDSSDEELPDLTSLLKSIASRDDVLLASNSDVIRRKGAQDLAKHCESKWDLMRCASGDKNTVTNGIDLRSQRPSSPLGVANVNSTLLPLLHGSSTPTKAAYRSPTVTGMPAIVRTISDKKVNQALQRAQSGGRMEPEAFESAEGHDDSTDLSGFVVPDSASEADNKSPQNLLTFSESDAQKADAVAQVDQVNETKLASLPTRGFIVLAKSILNFEEKTSSDGPKNTQHCHSAVGFELPTCLSYSPPRSKSPRKIKESNRPSTPPSLQTNPKLKSPSKLHRIPPSPHRPSVDAFWSAEVVNDWNKDYSPAELPTGLGKAVHTDPNKINDSAVPSSLSPSKIPPKSPSKRSKSLILRRKAFDATKNQLAINFLTEIDHTIADDQVSQLAASTGGIRISWSNKLSSTAGRANWRREVVRTKSPHGDIVESKFRHHASIDLAEKVIDNEDRLLNVIAHEYCHVSWPRSHVLYMHEKLIKKHEKLANFMISGVKDNPHGKEFRSWAKKCTKAFRHQGVNVTIKHDYEITYKYIWTCLESSCGQEYKRHSKSIDPLKHTCGTCKGKLAQTQPAPRAETDYQRYMKANWERVKRRLGEGTKMGEIMSALAKEFQAEKQSRLIDQKPGSIGRIRDDAEQPPCIKSAIDCMAHDICSLSLEA